MVILQHFLISRVFRMVTQPQVPLSRWIIIIRFFSSIYQLYFFLCYLALSPLPWLCSESSHSVGYMHPPQNEGPNLKIFCAEKHLLFVSELSRHWFCCHVVSVTRERGLVISLDVLELLGQILVRYQVAALKTGNFTVAYFLVSFFVYCS